MNKIKGFRPILLLCIGFLALPYGCKMNSNAESQGAVDHATLVGENNLAYRWATVILQATANDTERFKPRPTVTSRFLGLICTSIFDAWSRFDAKATPVYLNGVDRRPESEQNILNKEKAISYAAYRTLNEYFFSDSTYFKKFMVDLGFDPNDQSLDPTTPQGIGNLAAKAIIEARKHDGSNQYAEEEGSNGVPYFDYTHYTPVNTPDHLNDVIRWQSKYFSDGKGGKFAPTCLTPMWGKVKPLALKSPDQFRSPPPPPLGSKQLEDDVRATVEYQANLTDEQRALVEFMRDGPASVQQAGHWFVFARDVSVRDQHTLDQDVKMYFLVEATAMDAFIACWDTKMFYDFARPYCLIHYYFDDKEIEGWAGPEKGKIKEKGKDWRPYSPDTFLCPPFPSYVSGHSTVSGGCSKVLELFTKSDEFGASVRLVPGAMTETNRLGDTVTINFPTFTQAADMAGLSRVMGGYHIPADNVEGLALGRNVGNEVFKWYQGHVGEVASN